MSRFWDHISTPLQESPTELKRHTSILAEYRTLCLPIFVDRACLNLPPGFFGYCDVVLLAEALHSRQPFVLGTAKKAVHARYPADGCHNRTLPTLFAGPLRLPLVAGLQLGRSPIQEPEPDPDSNSSPSDVCMPQNAHRSPYYLVWAGTKYRA